MEISNPMDYKTALYMRLSKEDDYEETKHESESVTNQRSLLTDFATKNRLDIYGEYVDDGYSGTNFDRPDFQRLLADIAAKKINLVITKDMSRLGRDYILTGYYLERFFPENHVRYISLLDGVDTGTDSSANDITPFKAIMNDMYAKDISKKITSVKRDKQKKGLFIGGKASYGYKISKEHKNTIEIDEPAAAVVRKIFQLALDGESCRQIAQILNDEDIPTPAAYAKLNISVKGPYSGMWSSECVTRMLKNEVYIGNMVQGRVKKVNYKVDKCIKLPPDQWTVVENTHEPIVNVQDFGAVQKLIKSRTGTRFCKIDYLLKGLVYCHECGYTLNVIKRTYGENWSRLYFVCRTYQRFTKYKQCTCHNARVDVITEAVLTKIREIIAQYLDRQACQQSMDRAIAERNREAAETATLENAMARQTILTAQLDQSYNDKLAGILDEDDFKRIYEKIKNERDKLKETIAELQSKKKNPSLKQPSLDELIEKFLASTEYNRELLVSLVDRIELTENKELILFFRFKQLEDIKTPKLLQ